MGEFEGAAIPDEGAGSREPACLYLCGEVVEDGGGLGGEADFSLACCLSSLNTFLISAAISSSEYSGTSPLKSAGNAGAFKPDVSMVENKFGVGGFGVGTFGVIGACSGLLVNGLSREAISIGR